MTSTFIFAFSLFFLRGIALGQEPSLAPGRPNPPPQGNNISVFDDRVFNIDAGEASPETRTSVGGNTRYLDKTKPLDYNAPQRERWISNCASLRDSDSKAFRECVDAQKKKETQGQGGSRSPKSSPLDGLTPSKPSGNPEPSEE